MAILFDMITSEYGVPFSGAYFRIISASVFRTRDQNEKFNVLIDVSGYATQPSNEDTRSVDFKRFTAPYSVVASQPDNDFIAKCYTWVMMQPEMNGSQAT